MKLDFKALEQAHVLVVGDVMLDRYWFGPTSRISPEAPVPIVRVDGSEDRPGGAANVALNIASLGARVTLSGLVGQDDNASLLEQALSAADIATDFQHSELAPTITKLRVMSRSQQLIRLDFEQSFGDIDTTPLTGKVMEGMAQADLLILSDYGKGTLAHVQDLIRAGRAAGKRVLVDPKGQDFERYRGASIITPNLNEFEAVVGPCPTDDAVAEKGEALRASLDLEALLVTRSERGMTLIRKQTAPLQR